MNRRAVRAASWLGGLVGALLVLRLWSTGDLAGPPLTSLDDLATWAEDRGPVGSAIALVRLAAELVVWYLLGLSVLHALASVLRIRGALVLADALALPGAARLVHAGLGAGLLAATAITGDDSAAAPSPERGTATMVPADGGSSSGTARMVPLPDPADDTPPPSGVVTLPAASTHQVEAGESFWSIAEDTLAGAWGRTPTDAEIDPFWRALVEVNRHRLVGDDPDHILPGQVFEVPAVPRPPA